MLSRWPQQHIAVKAVSLGQTASGNGEGQVRHNIPKTGEEGEEPLTADCQEPHSWAAGGHVLSVTSLNSEP